MCRKFLCCFKILLRPPQGCFVSSSPSHPAENILPSTQGGIKAGLSRGHLSPRGVPTGQFHVSLFELKAGFLQGAHSTGRQETKPPLCCPSAPHRGPAPAPQPTVKHHGGISQKGREAQKKQHLEDQMLTRVASSKARKRGQESAPCWEAPGSSQGSRQAAEDGAPWPRATFSLNYLAAETGSHSSQHCLSPNYSWAALKHRDRAVGAAQGSQSWRHMGTVLPAPRQGDITASKPYLAPGPGDQRSQPGLMSFASQPLAHSLRSPPVSTVTVKDYKNTKNVLKKKANYSGYPK